MILRLRTSHYRFIYTFTSGHKLVGTVKGDSYVNQPDVIFNLRSLRAIGLNPEGCLMMGFDDVFGQFHLAEAEPIVSGSHSQKGSFFSINYRNSEACIYDAVIRKRAPSLASITAIAKLVFMTPLMIVG